MSKEYHKHIVSTSEHQVWLHRTSKDLIDKIMKEGLRIGERIDSTATKQPRDLEEAEELYGMEHKTGSGRDSLIVVKLPRDIVERYGHNGPEGYGAYTTDKDITYVSSGEKGDVMLHRKYVHGWIDRKTGEYMPNPYLSEPQKLTEKHFPAEFYGGLKEEVLESQEEPKGEQMDLPPPNPQDFIP